MTEKARVSCLNEIYTAVTSECRTQAMVMFRFILNLNYFLLFFSSDVCSEQCSGALWKAGLSKRRD